MAYSLSSSSFQKGFGELMVRTHPGVEQWEVKPEREIRGHREEEEKTKSPGRSGASQAGTWIRGTIIMWFHKDKRILGLEK